MAAAPQTMTTVAIVTRRLREGKTYDDFRKAWYHKTGFGTPSWLYTVVSAADPREITIIAFIRSTLAAFAASAEIDVAERLGSALDDIVEPAIGRSVGLLIAEDDFSASGPIAYSPPAIGSEPTDLDNAACQLADLAAVIARASAARDRASKG
jgi:hypothetical protein